MKAELFPFQKIALAGLRVQVAEALGSYHRTHTPQVVSFTAPTGAGKTIIMASLIEEILFGNESFAEQQNAVFVWISDSPQLNMQSRLKIETKADKIRLRQCVTVTEDSFDQEFFDDGHIYFLNTQKLSKTSNLTKSGDGRSFTIWSTLANTVREKSNRLYFIIDEAHRGMQGREAGRATTIMQKFIKGSRDDGIPPMPVVIGMSATPARFNRLVEGTSSTIHKTVVSTDEVRASGLLKDRIVITYPEEKTMNKDMAVLQAAADDWKEKWDHWYQYCFEQHYAYVNPILIIQVLNATGKGRISDTDLDDCLSKVEERIGFRFEKGQVVHTFSQTAQSITINGLEVPYEEPSDISDNKNIRVVFFKDNLSTGWDCPRAETMMSFRHANDATYISQLLGRMIRTPMQMHINVDDVLNDVHLYLPYFREDTVKDIIKELQGTEGADIPADIYEEQLGRKQYDTLTVRPNQAKKLINTVKREQTQIAAGQGRLMPDGDVAYNTPSQIPKINILPETNETTVRPSTQEIPTSWSKQLELQPSEVSAPVFAPLVVTNDKTPAISCETEEAQQEEVSPDLFDREGVMKFINDSGLLTYDVRTVQISDYLKSLFKLVGLLSITGLYPKAVKDTNKLIIDMIRSYIDKLIANGKYDEYVEQVKKFELTTQIFDAFGETIIDYSTFNSFITTDTDIDRQLRIAESKLGGHGISNEYGKLYCDDIDPMGYKIDVILYAASENCMKKLHSFAEKEFHRLNDDYRRKIALISDDKKRKQFDSIISDGDIVSKHNFRLPETIQVPHDAGGKKYKDHLFVDGTTGTALLKLNSWEQGVIAEEEAESDFVCFIRNPSRGSWALCFPYEMDKETQRMYPDFIIVRKDTDTDYVVDILEPHDPSRKDKEPCINYSVN